jgi:hypothetical protein
MHLFKQALIASLLFAVPAAAAPADLARQFADDFAVPRFQAVAAAAHAQEGAWTNFCSDPAHGDVESLKQAYQNLSDAWSDVEFVRIGPAAAGLRVERFNWWLDRTDATGKALTAMLAAKPDDLAPEKLAKGSVAGQGLPVVERLLFPAAEAAKLKKKDGVQRCIVGVAVSRGQSAIADQIVGDWTSADGARAALVANTAWKFSFANADEAASVMMTDLVAGLEALKDLKVAMEFHDIMNPKSPPLAEAPRSGLTLRDIARNLAAIRQGAAIFLAQATPAQKAQMEKAFNDADRALKGLQDAKGNTARVAAVKQMLAVFGTLSQTAMTVLPQATGLTLGFNSLDGD